MGSKIIQRPQKEQLIKVFKTKNYTEIGRAYGVSRTTIKRWFQEYGIYSAKGKKPVQVPSRDEIDRLISGGMKSEALAEHYQVHVTTISTWLRLYGLMSFRARERFKKMAEKLDQPKVEKPNPSVFSFGAASGNAPQFGFIIEHRQQARAL